MVYQFARPGASPRVGEAPLTDPFITRLLSLGGLTPEQAGLLAAMQGPPRQLPSHTEIGRGGGARGSAYVMHEGWALTYMPLADGRRHVHGFLLPGNLVRLGDLLGAETGSGVETVTDAVVAEISMESLRRASDYWPELFDLLLLLQSRVELALVDQLVNLGRRDGRARVAHFLLRLERRLLRIGLAGPDGYACPISQYAIADALGFTPIHVNRILRALREEGVVTLRNHRVTIHDRVRLREITGEEQIEDTDNGVATNSGVALVHAGSRFT